MILCKRKSASISATALSSFLRRAQRAAGLSGRVNVLLTANEQMRRLNKQFRRRDKPTDVLSFPAYSDGQRPRRYAGDMAISVEMARESARKLGHSLQDEVKILMLHGILHLAGFDHESDHGEMADLEEKLRHRLRLPVPLTARSYANGFPGGASRQSAREIHRPPGGGK